MLSDKQFKEYLFSIGFNSLEINLVYLENNKTINTAKILAEVETNFKKELDKLFIESNKRIPKNVLEGKLNKLMEQNQKLIKSSLEETYGKSLRRTIDPALKIKNKKIAKQIASNYVDQYESYINQGLSKEEAIGKLQFKSQQISATEASRLTAEESDFQLKLKSKSTTWKAVLDRKTCKDCKRLNNKKNPKEKPPKHVNCRCFIIYEI